ncbi:MAG: inorganic phosphate transporter [Elusimicrobia bacterium RBG_16_66_12]|nr:MAG: inorganic phosphate transporter [Elusimicrobia bacterium RBG_16_66_12]
MTFSIVFVIGLAYLFDFLNGMHDAANSIATIVSTRVLSPRQAVVWAAFFNFIAAFGFGVHVANTIGKGLVDPGVLGTAVIAAALIGASLWDWITIVFGIPVSSSHALIGGIIGAAISKAGFVCLQYDKLKTIVMFIFLSPLIGLFFGFSLMVAVFWLFRKRSPSQVDRTFRVGQLISAALYSLSHGANDAQKTMGIISVLLFSNGLLGDKFYVPIWVVLSCHAVISLGTLMGGWKIVNTMGNKVTKLKPVGGFCAETGAGLSILICSFFGIPVSTTHTITGAIVGVGSTQRLSAVRWGVAGRIVWAWILTIPCAALTAGLAYQMIKFFL